MERPHFCLSSEPLIRAISGEIDSQINTHGPIVNRGDSYGASKRAAGQVISRLLDHLAVSHRRAIQMPAGEAAGDTTLPMEVRLCAMLKLVAGQYAQVCQDNAAMGWPDMIEAALELCRECEQVAGRVS